MNRRGFLGSMLAAFAAPAIVRADALMRVIPVETEVLEYYSQDIVIDQTRGHGLYGSARGGGKSDLLLLHPDAVKLFGATLFMEATKRSYFAQHLELSEGNHGSPIILG